MIATLLKKPHNLNLSFNYLPALETLNDNPSVRQELCSYGKTNQLGLRLSKVNKPQTEEKCEQPVAATIGMLPRFSASYGHTKTVMEQFGDDSPRKVSHCLSRHY
ncbi:hypothetical protein WJX77_006427 [Trebouxia sp. C0004]